MHRIILISGIFFSFLIAPNLAAAMSLGGAQDCDANAVIRCGLSDTSNAPSAYQAAGVSDIYNYFGISTTDINNLDSQAVAGRITSDGNVIVNGKTVATNAITAGRQNMPGSTAVTSSGIKFYTRPPSVSFASSSLPAYVVMDSSGRFSYAIIASCGNPVMATPVVVKKVTRAIPAVTKTSPPAQSQTQSQVQSQTVVYNVPAPAPQPAETPPAPVVQPVVVTTPAPAAATKTLPNTGPGNVLGIGTITAAFGGISHFLYKRRKAV